MKKKNLLFFLLPLFFIFIACQNQTEDTINIEKSDYTLYTLGRLGLDEDVEWQILLSCQKKLKSSGKRVAINDIWIEKYYGPYCPYYKWTEWDNNQTYPNNFAGFDWDAYYAGWDIFEAENKTLVAVVLGYEDQDTEQRMSINHSYGNVLVKNGKNVFVWNEGHLMDLKDRNSLRFTALFLEDFLSIANGQNGLELQTQLMIQEDYCKSMRRSWPPERYKELRIQYLGTHNTYIILITCITANIGLTPFTIGDVRFTGWRSGEDIFAWKEGVIFELTDLYEQELITRDDLVAMAYELGGGIE
jgi:hypothetical protein